MTNSGDIIMENNKKSQMTPEIRAMIKNAPKFSVEDIPELKDFKPGEPVARGFAQFKEYMNKNGDRSKSADPRVSVSIRIPLSYAERLRATGRGWQTRMSEYIVNGVNHGELLAP